MRSRTVVATMAMGLALASSVVAEERTVPLRDVTVVQNGRGLARVLFRLGDIEFSDRTVVERAVVNMSHAGSAENRRLELRICPITGAWSGWDTPFDEELGSRAFVDLRGDGAVVFDFTVPLKELLEEGASFDGFVLTSGSEAEGLALADLARLGGLSGVQVKVAVNTLPSGWPPRDRRE